MSSFEGALTYRREAPRQRPQAKQRGGKGRRADRLSHVGAIQTVDAVDSEHARLDAGNYCNCPLTASITRPILTSCILRKKTKLVQRHLSPRLGLRT